MPVRFLTAEQRQHYGGYAGPPTAEDLTQFFYLNDADLALIAPRRGNHNRLGLALQLTTVRFLGTFLEDPLAVPDTVLRYLARQLNSADLNGLEAYRTGEQRWDHAAEIRTRYGYRDFTDQEAGFRLARWLYGLCWTGTERPGVLFERATDWLLSYQVLLPGASVLERFVARVRRRVEKRLWHTLGQGITAEQQTQLEQLLKVSPGSRTSPLDQLRSGPVTVSGPSLVRALQRLKSVRDLGLTRPIPAALPPSRLALLARFAASAKVSVIQRLPAARRLATLVAFVQSLEATAQDDALEVLEILLRDLFVDAVRADRNARLRTLKDLDRAALTLAETCALLLDEAVPDRELRSRMLARTPPEVLEQALRQVQALTRPPHDVYFRELDHHYRSVRRYLPALLEHLRFGASPAGAPVVAALDWLRVNASRAKPANDAPRAVIAKAWQHHVLDEKDQVNLRAYTFCVLDELRAALRRRDVFATPSWRYADPRVGLLSGAEWEAARPIICRTLGLPADPQPILATLAEELDQTYREVAARLPENPAVRFETQGDQTDLIVSPLDKLEEPPSLIQLREAVAARLPRVDLPEILLEIAARTRFTEAFTHLTARTARVQDLAISVCAVLLAEACNTGPGPLVRRDIPALKRDRLAWVDQNYVREDTLIAANAMLVAAQSRIALAQAWGGGEVASADGLRFVVPVRTVHAGPNPKYFGTGRGVTWYNLVSDQFTGLHAITVPGTLRDSLILLAVVLEQQTELQPTQIMTDTGAYSDVVFGLFRLLGYRFSPRLADVGGTRFWRIDPTADYGEFNAVAKSRINTTLIAQHWDDLLRLAGSLKLGKVPATGIMRVLQRGESPTRLAQALAEFGRLEKTLYLLAYLDDETRRRATLTQLNRGEGRHSLARALFHGKRGELRQRYREGQEDQLGALGLVVNVIALWNTLYMEAVLTQLRQEGYPVRDEDVARLSPLIFEHINLLGRYSFTVPEVVIRGELRPLRDPAEEDA
ncbi:MAG: Tn3 family transposase [Candidatus Competibacteraceae bacterium]